MLGVCLQVLYYTTCGYVGMLPYMRMLDVESCEAVSVVLR